MKSHANVVTLELPKTKSFQMPRGFKAKQKAAWIDLIDRSDKSLHVAENLFTFELCAVLLAKFRDGEPMNATQMKELKKSLIQLGLARDDDNANSGTKKPPKKNAKYFTADETAE